MAGEKTRDNSLSDITFNVQLLEMLRCQCLVEWGIVMNEAMGLLGGLWLKTYFSSQGERLRASILANVQLRPLQL